MRNPSIGIFCIFASTITRSEAFNTPSSSISRCRPLPNNEPTALRRSSSPSSSTTETESTGMNDESFDSFSTFLRTKQSEIIRQIESLERSVGSNEVFSRDTWGIFADDVHDDGSGSSNTNSGSGGITRVIQRGTIVEKGACSFTILRGGKLTAERAASIQGRQRRQQHNIPTIREGDEYSAAALSLVMHTRSPMVPTFRSDVRIFLVRPSGDDDGGEVLAWFGGGADLTPYYLFDEDVAFFHTTYRDLCDDHVGRITDDDGDDESISERLEYAAMKKSCDDYFFLPARSEHRGTGGIFFDDLPCTPETRSFVEGVADAWMPSWFPIVEKRQGGEFTERQKEWQLLRRGRYLEFNLLYDRGVKFGLANSNPRVEGVMVSAPPLIAWEYNHKIEEGSEEARLMEILKNPVDWV